MLNLLKTKLLGQMVYKNLVSKLHRSDFDRDGIEKIINSNSIDLHVADEHGRTLLFGLAKKKRIEAIEFLLEHNININAEDDYGKTILSEAANDSFMLSFLISKGANIDYINNSNRTLIQDFAFDGSLKQFRFLFMKRANLRNKDEQQKTILFDAVEGENIEIVKDIINDFSTEELNSVDNEGKTALFYAVSKDNARIAKLLIEYGCDVNVVDNIGQNALFNAVTSGKLDLEVLRLLVKKGINLEQVDNQNNLITSELVKILKFLKFPTEELRRKYRLIDKKYNYVALLNELIVQSTKSFRYLKDAEALSHMFILKENYDDIKFLIIQGVEFNVVDKNGHTVLFPLVLKGFEALETIRLLVKYGVNVDQIDYKENTIVDYLVEAILIQQNYKKPESKIFENITKKTKYLELLKGILALKPKIDVVKSDGQTTIFEIIKYNNIKLLKLFVENGVNLNVTDLKRQTPISILLDKIVELKHNSHRNSFFETFSYILKLKINCNIVDENGKTILHKAVIANEYDVVDKLLRSRKVEIRKKDYNGRTALHYTPWSGNQRIAEILINAGCVPNEVDHTGYTIVNYATILAQKDLLEFLITQNALQFSTAEKDKKTTKFFLENEKNMEKLLIEEYSSTQLKERIILCVNTLKNEIRKEDIGL